MAEKTKKLDAVEENLTLLNIDPEIIQNLKEPVFRVAAIDLYSPLRSIIYRRVDVRKDVLRAQLNIAPEAEQGAIRLKSKK